MAKADKHAWVLDGNNRIVCYVSSKDSQIVAELVNAQATSPFHDATLAECTVEINALLRNARQSNSDPNRELAFLVTPKGLLLAWTEHAIGPDDDDEKINLALNI